MREKGFVVAHNSRGIQSVKVGRQVSMQGRHGHRTRRLTDHTVYKLSKQEVRLLYREVRLAPS